MAALLASIAATGSLWAASRKAGPGPGQPAKPAKSTISKRHMTTGVYGNISEVRDIIHYPGMVVSVTKDVDLTGVPCYWLELRNGGVYKSYDPVVPLSY